MFFEIMLYGYMACFVYLCCWEIVGMVLGLCSLGCV